MNFVLFIDVHFILDERIVKKDLTATDMYKKNILHSSVWIVELLGELDKRCIIKHRAHVYKSVRCASLAFSLSLSPIQSKRS